MRMIIDNISYSSEIGTACLRVALLPYVACEIAESCNLDNIQDVTVVLYLDLLDRFSRVTSTEK